MPSIMLFRVHLFVCFLREEKNTTNVSIQYNTSMCSTLNLLADKSHYFTHLHNYVKIYSTGLVSSIRAASQCIVIAMLIQ